MILAHLSSNTAVRLFRNNCGMAWAGEPVKKWTGPSGDEFITLRNPRPLRAGLVVGGSDYIGWKTLTITQDMVGQQVAQLLAIEMKKNKRSKRTEPQRNFINQVNKAGGRAGFATSIDEAERIVGE